MLFFIASLFALGLSFFFGLMTGLSGRPEAPAAAEGPVTSRDAVAPPPDARPAEGPRGGEGLGASSTTGQAEVPGPETAAPATLQAFEDRIPADPTPSPSTPLRMSPDGVWVQVASLTSRPEADALAGRLARRGYHAQIAVASGPKGRVFRVRVGPYRSEEEAGRMAERLRRQERIPQTWIVREGT